jgi:hypothetical protein
MNMNGGDITGRFIDSGLAHLSCKASINKMIALPIIISCLLEAITLTLDLPFFKHYDLFQHHESLLGSSYTSNMDISY